MNRYQIILNQDKNGHTNEAVIFEEFYHAAQHEYYGTKNGDVSALTCEVEAKVAKAIAGFISTDPGLKYEKDFADNNKNFIDKINSGEGLSPDDAIKFRSNVQSFSEVVADIYNLPKTDFNAYINLEYLESTTKIERDQIVVTADGSN